ncbi:MAG: asparaginase [Candidatus Melainabacteria bacterium]|nr:asparaginase [Candidatus Melainabacteria bacterium]
MDFHPASNAKQSRKESSILISVPTLSPEALRKRFLKQAPEIQQLAQCDVRILLNLDSAHIGPKEWLLIIKEIKKRWKSYDGIVLLHGTDTLAYSAAAMSFLLEPCRIPIVITGAQRPLAALRTDARNNLISAVEIAAQGPSRIKGRVTVVFRDQLFQGNRIRKKSASDYAAFESPSCAPLAIVGTTIRFAKPEKRKKRSLPKLRPKFSEKVMMIHLTPGFPSGVAASLLDQDLDGLVLVVFPSGTAPAHLPAFLEFLNQARLKKIPLVCVTEGSSEPPGPIITQISYKAGQELLSHGCHWAGGMTPECAFVKTALILGQKNGRRDFADLWKLNFADEGVAPYLRV